jgi:hypothetical protein
MKARKLYGNSVYINNEKVILSNQAIKVLDYSSDVFDGSFSSRIISALECIADSKEDIDIIKAAENSEIIEIDKNVKGFNFKGFAVISNKKCFGLYLDRDDSPICSTQGEKANILYLQLNN